MDNFVFERLLRNLTSDLVRDSNPLDLKAMRSGVVDPDMTEQDLKDLDALISSLAEIE